MKYAEEKDLIAAGDSSRIDAFFSEQSDSRKKYFESSRKEFHDLIQLDFMDFKPQLTVEQDELLILPVERPRVEQAWEKSMLRLLITDGGRV